MDSMCRLYIARHGQTTSNLAGIMQGHLDSDLTKKGEAQALSLGSDLKDISFDAVYSSDLIRAKRTAKIALLDKQLKIATTNLLRERNYGRFEGQAYEQLEKSYIAVREVLEKLDRQTSYKAKPFFDVESDEELVTRFIVAVREISLAHQNETVLVVAHGGIIRHFLLHLGLDNQELKESGFIRNAGYFILDSDGVDFFVRDTSCLFIKK